jgi:sulfate adenylyltransferase subunit 1 (EFTu-like GTPase family)
MSVALRLADDIDVGRGSTIARAHNRPTVSSSFACELRWMSEQPHRPPMFLGDESVLTALCFEHAP